MVRKDGATPGIERMEWRFVANTGAKPVFGVNDKGTELLLSVFACVLD